MPSLTHSFHLKFLCFSHIPENRLKGNKIIRSFIGSKQLLVYVLVCMHRFCLYMTLGIDVLYRARTDAHSTV